METSTIEFYIKRRFMGKRGIGEKPCRTQIKQSEGFLGRKAEIFHAPYGAKKNR